MLGKIERKERIARFQLNAKTWVGLTTEGVEVVIGNNSPWVITHETLVRIAEEELGAHLGVSPTRQPKSATTKGLTMKKLCKVVGTAVGSHKPLVPVTIRGYLRALGITHVKKNGHQLIFPVGTAEKLIAHAKTIQANKSRMASARYDRTTRRLVSNKKP